MIAQESSHTSSDGHDDNFADGDAHGDRVNGDGLAQEKQRHHGRQKDASSRREGGQHNGQRRLLWVYQEGRII